ncbi:MAG: hypothetical protein ACREBA_05870 [Nitrosotalea sp.]
MKETNFTRITKDFRIRSFVNALSALHKWIECKPIMLVCFSSYILYIVTTPMHDSILGTLHPYLIYPAAGFGVVLMGIAITTLGLIGYIGGAKKLAKLKQFFNQISSTPKTIEQIQNKVGTLEQSFEHIHDTKACLAIQQITEV